MKKHKLRKTSYAVCVSSCKTSYAVCVSSQTGMAGANFFTAKCNILGIIYVGYKYYKLW